ncbi:hypothetical protein ACH5RR_039636 [Cinchona calisaya]|uniref:Uncharacterized protein n=1 Tax=Cinchona calisaya TaxID=153742 RepID=A0ABD2Y053_9GENT
MKNKMELQNTTSWGFMSSLSANILLLLLVQAAMNLSITHASTAKNFGNETDRLALLEFKKKVSDNPMVYSTHGTIHNTIANDKESHVAPDIRGLQP